MFLADGETVWTLCLTDGPRMVPDAEGKPVARWGFFTGEVTGSYIPWQVYDPNATEEV